MMGLRTVTSGQNGLLREPYCKYNERMKNGWRQIDVVIYSAIRDFINKCHKEAQPKTDFINLDLSRSIDRPEVELM